MKEDIKIIERYVRQMVDDIYHAHLATEDLAEPYRKLGEALCQIGGYIREMCTSMDCVAEGNLGEELPGNDNPYAGALKQHVANLRHLTWQTKCIATGDYEQQVDFMGEFADAFNIMIKQLKNRKELTERNEQMQKLINQQRQETLQKELKNQIAYFEKLQVAQEELRSFRHDIKNHVLALSALLHNEDYDDALEYLETVSRTSLKTQKLVTSGNFVLDALLSEKGDLAKEKGINYSVEMAINKSPKMDNTDICVLFGNALDNAIEACEASDGAKELTVKIVKRGNMLNTVITNTAEHSPTKSKEGDFYETSKETRELHGIGMKNMAAVVEKYNGLMKSTWENKTFTLTFLLTEV